MRTKQIRIELFKVRDKKTMAQIAEETGVSRTMVTMVAKRERRSRHIMEAIANAIGKDPEHVWPELKEAS
jgi:lambda repressor-like predicted transcriptional regulator